MKKKILTLLVLCAILIACKKEVTIPNGGIYRGTFREYSESGDTLASGLCHIAMFEHNNSFVMVGDSVSGSPADHSGTYIVDNASNMQFSSSPSSGQFDIDHFLDTVYNYTFDDIFFNFWQTRAGKLYEYKLKRN